jgi:hypothetical protein
LFVSFFASAGGAKNEAAAAIHRFDTVLRTFSRRQLG